MLEWRTKCKTERVLLVDLLVSDETMLYETEEEEFDEFNLTNYMNNGGKFKHHDEDIKSQE